MKDWIILISLVGLPVAIGLRSRQTKNDTPLNRSRFYLQDVFINIAILLIYLALAPHLFSPLDFSLLGKGIEIPKHILSAVIPVFVVPLLLSLTPWDTTYPKEPAKTQELFGYPKAFLPTNFRECFVFFIYIVGGVVFEEAICRQFLFYYLNAQLGMQGDTLILISALLFSLGHLYQGWKGVFGAFITGVLLGKVFLIYETIKFPFFLHLLANLTVVVGSIKWIKNNRGSRNKPKSIRQVADMPD